MIDEPRRPGRLGDPALTLGTDPRTDPRLVAALRAFELDGHAAPAPFGTDAPLEDQLAFVAEAEAGFGALFGALFADLAPIEGIERDTTTIPGRDGDEITLYVHRPAGATGPLPAVYHIHGGGMVLLRASDAQFVRWRDELAAAGLVVVGVEFRNGGGVGGAHPFPAGLHDCVDALRWVAAHRNELGIGTIVVSGESGGGNLTLATVLSARRDGWLREIAGAYAQCPYISNAWAVKDPSLPSLYENDGYFLDCQMMSVLANVYDPGQANAKDPTCWPLGATMNDLAGLPPHVISVNELDPLRDEGLTYARRLAAAGVPTVSRTVNGTSHAADCIFAAAMPDVYAATVRDIAGFARSL